MPHREHRGASVGQTAGYFTRCLVTAVVVNWLIVFAPLTCSYHGFLLRPGAVPAAAVPMGDMGMGGAHMHRDPQDNRDTVTLPRSSLVPTLAGHHTSEGETAMLSLLMLAAPTLYQLEPLANSHARFFELPAAALHPRPPPEQPPRTA
jgi:hypothetical protein